MSPRRAVRLAVAAGLAAALPAVAAAPASAQQLLRSWGTLGDAPTQFRDIKDVVADARGYVYVLDETLGSSGRVQKFTADGRLIRTFGRPNDPDDQRRTEELPGAIDSGESLAIGPDGTVYVGEAGPDRARVSVWSPLGEYRRAFGSRGDGPGQFRSAAGLAVDGAGNVLVGDSSNQRVVVFTNPGAFAGTIGAGTSLSAVDEPTLGSTDGLTFGPNGLLYVGDSPQVKLFRPTGEFAGLFGQRADDPGPFFQDVSDLAFAGPVLYVSDRRLSRVQAFTETGGYLGQLGAGPGSQPGQLTEPTAVTTDCRGAIYVADAGNRRIQKFGPAGATPCGDVTNDPQERFLVKLGGPTVLRFREDFAAVPQVTCDRPCTATVTGTVRISGRRRAVRLEPAREVINGPAPVRVAVAPSEAGTDAIAAALRRRKRVSASLRLSVRDLAGKTVVRTRVYRLR
ncbi:hypothetical protein GKE82_13545 [Conexibacter sp. W3-3-2]|uniref:hypothetical protein n=1 Tax=Conexibacter sp. W3-3-2 TaxID=2675227 RepID=UPI0012B8330B|nr:hypothetical protein [Conexibacter sp. W3-3-2]MTD45282.1 hypothetical protein [Conexibacter sp. W3-3-2]